MKRQINKIVIHCSDSEWGCAEVIDKWHKAKGWDGIGYHFVIGNGRPNSINDDYPARDGQLESGREVNKPGAHVKGHNSDSIGICLIGRNHFTGKQLLDTLPRLLASLCVTHNLTVKNIYGHNYFNTGKTCPNLNMDHIRALVVQRLAFQYEQVEK